MCISTYLIYIYIWWDWKVGTTLVLTGLPDPWPSFFLCYPECKKKMIWCTRRIRQRKRDDDARTCANIPSGTHVTRWFFQRFWNIRHAQCSSLFAQHCIIAARSEFCFRIWPTAMNPIPLINGFWYPSDMGVKMGIQKLVYVITIMNGVGYS